MAWIGLPRASGLAYDTVLTWDTFDRWLAKIEADIFWTGNKSSKQAFSGQSSQLFGYFDNASQLVFRLTRQF